MNEDVNDSEMRLEGQAYPPQSSRQVRSVLHVSGDVLRLIAASGQELAMARIEFTKIAAPLGSAPRRVTFPDGTLFETEDHQAIAGLAGPTTGAVLHQWEAYHPRLIAVIIAGLAACWVVWRYGLDILVSAAIWLTPPVFVEQLDRGTLRGIDLTMAYPTSLSEDRQAHVQAVFDHLIASLEPEQVDERKFNLNFRNTPSVGPNAFALPGGSVVITDQFVDEFGDDDMLAGVLSHELGHVVEQHGLRQLYRSLSLYLLVAFIAGDTGPILEDVLLEGNLLLSLSFSRAHERSADQFGVALSHEAGFDPSGLRDFFEKIREISGDGPEWLSTHPSSSTRMEDIDSAIRALR